MNCSSPGGWRNRVKKTQEKQAARDDMAAIRAERARMDIAKAVADAEQAALNDAASRAVLMSCPCCKSEGRVTVEQAELIYRALERLPSDSRPDPTVLANLARIARSEPVHGSTPKVALALSHPAPVQPTATPTKAKKLNKINRVTDDGALIELD